MTLSDNQSLCVLLNVRINDLYRLNRLLMLISQLSQCPNIFFSIRVRGKYSQTASEELIKFFYSKNFVSYDIFIGDTYKQWRMNTLVQIMKVNHCYFLLLQEDHYLVSSIKDLNDFISECILENCDLAHITAHHTYKETRDKLLLANMSLSKNYGSYYVARSKFYLDAKIEKPRYLVPLVAYFDRRFLIKILCSNRPYSKKYPALSPFNFEQGPTSTWFLPIKVGFSSLEIFACIDDDIGMPNSSLQSRGILPIDKLRIGEHHNSTRLSVQDKFLLIKKLVRKQNNGVGVYESITNSRAKLLWVILNISLDKFAKFIDILIYSGHSFLNQYLNLPEFFLRVRARNKL